MALEAEICIPDETSSKSEESLFFSYFPLLQGRSPELAVPGRVLGALQGLQEGAQETSESLARVSIWRFLVIMDLQKKFFIRVARLCKGIRQEFSAENHPALAHRDKEVGSSGGALGPAGQLL